MAAIAPQLGSYNASPHFRNIETHLDAVIQAHEAANTDERRLELTPLEIYLLLAAVLLHDIGRTQRATGHASISQKIIKEHFSALGVPSPQIAESLGRICLYHDPGKKRTEKEFAKSELREATIDPHGRVREKYVATLLSLADHLDGCYSRVLPWYIKGIEEIEVVGAFRRLVGGAEFDPGGMLVRESLRSMSAFHGKRRTARIRCFLNATKRPPGFIRKWFSGGKRSHKNVKIERRTLRGRCQKQLKRRKLMRDSVHPPNLFRILFGGTQLWFAELPLFATGYVQFEKYKVDYDRAYPPEVLVAVLMNDVRNNQVFLSAIAGDLLKMGLPARAWLIEYNGHLFNWRGEETYEPRLSRHFLTTIAREMWDLRRFVFGANRLTHNNLVDALRASDLSLIRMAVERLSRVSKGAIHVTADDWSWVRTEYTPDDLKQDLELLGEPV